MGWLKILPDDEPKLKVVEPDEEIDVYKEGRQYLQENFLEVVSKMIEEAKNGNLNAAKFIYPLISELLKIEEREVDIAKEMGTDDESGWE